MHQLPLPPRNFPGTHFCWRLSQLQGHSVAGRIMSMSMKNSNDTIGNRTCDLPGCNTVPQPTAPPWVPVMSLSASLQHKTRVAMDRVCPVVLNWKLSHQFKSGVNFQVALRQSCAKDLAQKETCLYYTIFRLHKAAVSLSLYWTVSMNQRLVKNA